MREALNSLALAGVFTHDPHRGFFLTKYSPTEIAQLYFGRGVLDVQIGRSISWPSAKEMKALRATGAVMDEAARAGDAGRWLNAHDRFHSMLLSLSPFKVLVEEADRLVSFFSRDAQVKDSNFAPSGATGSRCNQPLGKSGTAQLLPDAGLSSPGALGLGERRPGAAGCWPAPQAGLAAPAGPGTYPSTGVGPVDPGSGCARRLVFSAMANTAMTTSRNTR